MRLFFECPYLDDGSFAIVIELQDDKTPSVTHGKVSTIEHPDVERGMHFMRCDRIPRLGCQPQHHIPHLVLPIKPSYI